jgi:hypothetical protein
MSGMFDWMVNIESPSTVEDVLKLRAFVDKNSRRVGVNGVYSALVEMAEKNQVWLRPGYQFCLWFVEETLAKKFAEEWNGELKRVGSAQ